MKRVLIIGVLTLVFIGCGESNQAATPQPTVEAKKDVNVKQVTENVKNTATKVVNQAQKLLDPCERDRVACIADCKITYVTQDEDLKKKACIAKCYTIYTGCKTAEAAKKGYQITKEVVKKGYEKTKEFIKTHTDN